MKDEINKARESLLNLGKAAPTPPPAKNDQESIDTLEAIFGKAIYTYTRAQAIADGVLVDASIGDLAEVSRQHYKFPIAMTREVWEMIDKAVKNKKHCNDYKGVWHDILFMSKAMPDKKWETGVIFRVIITGIGRAKYHTFKLLVGAGDNGEGVMTLMLPDQD